MTDPNASLLLPLDELPKRVMCVARQGADAVQACGGALALHAKRGDDIRLLVLETHDGELDELRTAARELGVEDVVTLAIRPGDSAPDVMSKRLQGELLEYAPECVYAPSPFEPGVELEALQRALLAAAGPCADATFLLYGLTRQVPGGVVLDTTAARAPKKKALEALTSLPVKTVVAQAKGSDVAYTRGLDAPKVKAAEGFVRLLGRQLAGYARRAADVADSLQWRSTPAPADPAFGLPKATAVISTWNKKDDVRENLIGLLAQTRPFEAIVVVDNASSDGTPEMIAREFPDVRLIVMPHSRYGACETFNIGFASSLTELTAILDDDVVLSPDWLEKTTQRMVREPSTTAIVSTKIVEPGMPDSYKNSDAVNRERYMSTFRGCASLARTKALSEAGGYDERLFIYGNERDLTCRLLNLGYRVLQYPEAEAFHKTPFGIKMGKRSLYFHARNAWLAMLKYAPLGDLARMPFLVVSRVLLRSSAKESAGEVTDATGTIGIARSLRETSGAWWVLTKAACSVLYNIPYCWKHRQPVTSADFELPIE